MDHGQGDFAAGIERIGYHMGKPKKQVFHTWLQLYQAVTDGNKGKLGNAVEKLARDELFIVNANELTPDFWKELKNEEEERKRTTTRTLIGISIIACFALLILGAVKGVDWWKNRSIPTPTLAAAILPLETFPPESTPTSTVAVTPTDVPTETPTLTEVPVSEFLLTMDQIASLQPIPPMTGDAYFLLEAQAAQATPGFIDSTVWSIDEYGNQYTAQAASIFWELEVHPPTTTDTSSVSDVYQVFIEDTVKYSDFTQSYTVTIQNSNGELQNNRFKYGESTAYFEGKKQQEATWLSLGVYQIQVGEKLKVEAAFAGDGKEKIISRLLVIQLTPQEVQLMQQLSDLASGSTQIWVVDDRNAKILTMKDGVYVPDNTGWAEMESASAWGGKFNWHSNDINHTQINWQFPGIFIKGDYKAFVFIPDVNATIKNVTYKVMLGENQAPPSPVSISQDVFFGQWVPIGNPWILERDNILTIQLGVPKPGVNDPITNIGIDAAAIVRIP